MSQPIAVIGSSNIDLIMTMDRLPKPGETVIDADFFQVYGGKGANQAVAAARAGGTVYFVSCVGQDAYTPPMLANFEADGIDGTYIFQSGDKPSGHALILIEKGGENSIAVAPGANYQLSVEWVEKALQGMPRPGLIILQCEIPADTTARVIDWAADQEVAVLWNFAPARDFALGHIGKVEFLVLNESEAEFLSGEAVSGMESARKAATVLLAKGVRQVLITLGKAGVLYVSAEASYQVPAFTVEAVDTTAAGDVFCGAFGVAWQEGQAIPDALRFACAASALAVQRLGAQPSAPSRAEITAFMADRN